MSSLSHATTGALQKAASAVPAEAGVAPEGAEQLGQRSASAPVSVEPEAQRAKRQRVASKQNFQAFVVYDFEATCQRLPNQIKPQEIIEFSCVILDAGTLEIGAHFQEYVRPTEHRLLTDFCVQLTGITQDRVDRGLPLVEVLRQHSEWLKTHGLLGPGKQSWAPITWSEWDLKVQLETECKWRHIPKPSYLQRWIDLRPHYAKFVNRPCGLRGSVEQAGLEWQGRLHSGIDDAINTARLAAFMMRERGALLTITGSFTGLDKSGQMRQTTLFPHRPQKKHRIMDDAGVWNGKCECGVKAHVRTVNRPGVNHGRRFYGCGTWTILTGGKCDLLKWVDDTSDDKACPPMSRSAGTRR